MPRRPVSLQAVLEKSAVKLFTIIRRPNQYQPWDFGYQESSGGSGCILSGNRILTNAHVVSDSVFVQALRAGGTKRYNARVVFVDHGSEVALLEVDDPSFFEGSLPVTFGDLPRRQDRVAVYGFPMGGEQLSITEGIVSRIEVHNYSHSRQDLIAVQTDAAINPGNSGGPVFKDDKLVGIAFESYSSKGLENTGYFVPIPVIRHFLEDVEDGICEGVPGIGIAWQKMENDKLREYRGMRPGQTGILVNHVVYGSSAWGVIEEGDVITALDGVSIANDGTVELRAGDRIGFVYLITQRHVGHEIEVVVLRGGKSIKLRITLKPPALLVPRPRYDTKPTYYLFAGFLFLPLTHDYLKLWEWPDVDPRFRYYASHGVRSAKRKEIVLLSQVLAHEINEGYHGLHHAVVEKFNERPIAEMKDVVKGASQPLGKYHVIELSAPSDYGPPAVQVVIDAGNAARATQDILARYGIPSDRSPDLESLRERPRKNGMRAVV